MNYLDLKRDETNSGIYLVDRITPDPYYFINNEILIVTINCVQPFTTIENDGYAYTKLINEACAFIKSNFKEDFFVINPVFHHHSAFADTGVRKINFECTIVKA